MVLFSHNTILRWVEHLRLKGDIMDKKARAKCNDTRKCKKGKRSVNQEPRTSARRHASKLQINRESVRRLILHKELKQTSLTESANG